MLLLGERIKELRMSRKYSQKELARILQVSAAAVCNMESNLRQPSLLMLLKISSVFHVSVDYLLDNQPESGYFSTRGLSESQIRVVNYMIQAFHNENGQQEMQ